MRNPLSAGKPVWLRPSCPSRLHAAAFAVLLLAAAPASADPQRVNLAVAQIDAGTVRMSDLRVQLLQPDAADLLGHEVSMPLHLRIKRLELADFDYRLRDLDWQCALSRIDPDGWGCSGSVRARGFAEGALELSLTPRRLLLTLRHGRTRIGSSIDFTAESADGDAGAAPFGVAASRIPVQWLQPLLDSLWPEATFNDGSLDFEIQVEGLPQSTRVSGDLTLRGGGLDTRDGRIAAAGLGLSGALSANLLEAGTDFELDLDLGAGELLLGDVYVALPEHPVDLQVTAMQRAAGLEISRFSWTDPGALDLEIAARFAAGAAPDGSSGTTLARLQLRATSPDLSVLVPRYLDSLLGTLGLGGLQASGGLQLGIGIESGELQQLTAEPAAVALADAGGRFAFDGLAGKLALSGTDAVLPGRLRWRQAALHGIRLGPAELAIDSSRGGAELAAPVPVELLGGRLALRELAWYPAAGEDDSASFSLAGALEDIDLAQLASQFEWPAFGGSLSGEIPGASYVDGVLTLDGGLSMDVFGGEIELAAVTLERPFGTAPTLATDIRIAGLDLKPLTSVFGFGEITGRLNGTIGNLRLVDWTPVAFDASFRTSKTADDKRRISQRAVNDLSTVGGAGLVAGLQQQVLRVFDTFPYEQIGLDCRLANNVCEMGGLDGSGNGYTIVKGSGLPRITVNGFQRRVDWPVLVARLQAVTEGQAPTFD